MALLVKKALYLRSVFPSCLSSSNLTFVQTAGQSIFDHSINNMHALSITKAIVVGLLASTPLAAAFGISDVAAFEKRHVVSTSTILVLIHS